MNHYPKWLFHATEAPCIVADPAEHEALGAGWEETPAAHAQPSVSEPAADDAADNSTDPATPAPKPRRRR